MSKDILKAHPLFQDFTAPELQQLEPFVDKQTLNPGEFLIREGDAGKTLFIIQTGSIEILKKGCPLSSLGKGEVLGEMAWLKKAPRFASAKATTATTVLSIPLDKLSALSKACQLKMQRYFSKELTNRLKSTGLQAVKILNKQLEEVKARSAMGKFIVYLIALIFLYFYSMIVIKITGVTVVSSTVISIPVLIVFGVSMLHLMQSSGYPLSIYGITLKNGKKALLESAWITLVVLGLLVVIKWFLVKDTPFFEGDPLFKVSAAANPYKAHLLSALDVILLIASYCMFIPVQELIYRGAIQSFLQKFLLGPHRIITAILISNLPFSMIHLHLSFTLAIIVYFFGLLWGWMYYRHRTLAGVILSHLIIGTFAFFILGVPHF